MAILGDRSFLNPGISELIDEAFERAGIAAKAIGNDHIDSALRSIRLMLNSEWPAYGIRRWAVGEVTVPMVAGENGSTVPYVLPIGCMDIIGGIIRRSGADVPLVSISEADYLTLPNKNERGRPDRYVIRRRYNGIQIVFWRTPENSTDVVVLQYISQTSLPGENIQYTLELPPYALEAFVSGLAAKIAVKWSIERAAMLLSLYNGGDQQSPRGALGQMLSEDRERVDTNLSFNTGQYYGRLS